MSDMPISVVEYAASPYRRGVMQDPSAVGRASLGGRPPEVIVFLKVNGDTIAHATFEAHGCGYTVACCSVLMELVEGKPLSLCQTLTPAAVLDVLGDVPAHRRFCATLAVEAIQDAAAQLEPQSQSR